MELPLIRTERTVLKVLRPDEAPLMAAYYAENRTHLAPWEPLRDDNFYLPEAWQERVEKSVQNYASGGGVNFSALDPSSGRMIASCNFSNIVQGAFRACHLGYSIAADCEGRGLMHEVLQAGIRHMFEVVKLHRIMANHMPSNTRSESLLRKLGFEREGYARAYLNIAGKWEDHVLNALINPGLESA